MIFNRKELHEALRLANKFTLKKSSVVICGLVKVDCGKGAVVSTDLEAMFETKLEIQDGKPCDSFVVDPVKLRNIVKSLKTETIEAKFVEREEPGILAETSKILEINGIFRVFVLSTEDYPVFPKPELEKVGSINSDDLFAVASVTKAEEAGRPHISSVHFNADENQVEGTDGNRLYVAKTTLKNDKSVIVPARGIKAFCGNNKGKKMAVYMGDGYTKLSTGKSKLVVKNVDCMFPRTIDLVERARGGSIITTRKEDFETVIQQAATMSTRELQSVVVEFSEKGMSFSIFNPEVGDYEQKNIAAKCEIGENIEAAFNTRFIGEILSVTKSEYVVMRVKNQESPLYFFADNVEAFIMPMRI